MAVIGFSLLSVLVHTRPVGLVPGISFLVLQCLALIVKSGRVEFLKPEDGILLHSLCDIVPEKAHPMKTEFL